MSDDRPVTSREPRPDPMPDLRGLVLLSQDMHARRMSTMLDVMRLHALEPSPILIPIDARPIEPPTLQPFMKLETVPRYVGIDWASEPIPRSRGMRRHVRRLKAAGLPVPPPRRGLPLFRAARRRALQALREETDRAFMFGRTR